MEKEKEKMLFEVLVHQKPLFLSRLKFEHFLKNESVADLNGQQIAMRPVTIKTLTFVK